MKLKFLYVLVMTLTLAGVLCCRAASDVVCEEISYCTSEGEIYKKQTGSIYSAVRVSNDSDVDSNILAVAVICHEDKILDISAKRESVLSGCRKTIKTDYVNLNSENQNLKTLVFKNGLIPLSESAYLTDKSCKKEIKTATAVVGGKSYAGCVFAKEREIEFYPELSEGEEYALPEGFESASIKIVSESGYTREADEVCLDMKSEAYCFAEAEDGSRARYRIKVVPVYKALCDDFDTYITSSIQTPALRDIGSGSYSTNNAAASDFDANDEGTKLVNITINRPDKNTHTLKIKKTAENSSSDVYRLKFDNYQDGTTHAVERFSFDFKVNSISDGGISFVFATPKTEFGITKSQQEGYFDLYVVTNNKNYYNSSETGLGEKIASLETGVMHKIEIVDKNSLPYSESGVAMGVLSIFANGKELAEITTHKGNHHFMMGSKPGDMGSGRVMLYALENSVFEVEIDNLLAAYATRKNIEAVLGKPTADESIYSKLSKFDSLLNQDVLYWLLDLYDPDTGAFYYTKSGADNKQNDSGALFLPDSEATSFALSILQDGGICDSTLPDWWAEKLGGWVQKNQSEDDGYFYHVQWGKTYGQLRASRDTQSSVAVLKKCGKSPLYPLPWERTSATLLSTATDDDLKDKESFIAYLDSLNWNSDGIWLTGTYLVNMESEIIAAGRRGDLLAYLNKKQKSEFGVWGDDLEKREDLTLQNTNGAMKLSSFFTPENPYPNIDKLIESTLYIMENCEFEGVATHIWNPIVCLLNALSSQKSIEKEILVVLYRNADLIIDFVYENSLAFKREDGGFSEYTDRGLDNIQGGAPVGMGVLESDMDGTVIISQRIRRDVYKLFGFEAQSGYYSEYKEWFLNEIKNKPSIIK